MFEQGKAAVFKLTFAGSTMFQKMPGARHRTSIQPELVR